MGGRSFLRQRGHRRGGARRARPGVEALETRFLPAGSVTGLVFRDYNANGVQDTREPGVGGITVTAFDAANVAVATTTTSGAAATLGQYTLAIPGATTRVRLEFTGLPSYLQSGAYGPQSGTSVQFVDTAGGTATAPFSVNNPADYAQAPNQLDLVTVTYHTGNQLTNADGSANVSPVLISMPYTARGTTPNVQPVLARANQIGTVYGLAYQRSSNTLFASALMRRHAGFGPSGTGAIYRIDRATNAVTTLIDLNQFGALFATGADPHPTANGTYDTSQANGGGSPWFRDLNSIDAVSKVSLGDLDVSEDGRTLYTINLNSRELIAIPLTADGQLDPNGTLRRTPVPLTTANDALNFNAPGDIRPFGLGIKDGLVYVGMVYSAQADALTLGVAAARTRLRAYVYTFNPTTQQFSAAPVLQTNLDYERGSGDIEGTAPAATDPRANWLPWTSTFQPQPGQQFPSLPVYPQPILSDIAFDNGDLILGFRDRMGDQGSYLAGSLDGNDPTTYTTISAGDILRAAATGNGTWTIVDNPNGGEYYFNDQVLRDTSTPGNPNLFGHQEITLGSVVQIAGARQVATSAYDAYAGFTGSVLWFDNVASAGRQAGQNDEGDVIITQRPLPFGVTPGYLFGAGGVGDRYQVFATAPSLGGGVANPPVISKANGLGDVDALAAPAPLEIGNRVWRDRNANGIQDADDPGIPGVLVRLLDANGAPVAQKTTDARGEFIFTDLDVPGGFVRGGTYRIAVASAQVPLTGLSLTTTRAGTNIAIDSDAVTSGGDSIIAVTTGTDGQNNHTFDVGYVGVAVATLSLGNLVWSDPNNNGVVDAGEPGLVGVTVNLYRDSNGDGTPDGAAIGTLQTNATGNYLFTGLTADTYLVEVVTPAGFLSSTGTVGSATGPYEPAPDPDTNLDNDDNGTTAGTVVRSAPVTLAFGTEPTGEPATPGFIDPAADADSNLTVDFGFFRPMSLGNRVWLDTNNNGLLDGAESGIAGVTVNLYRDSNADGTPDGAVLGTTATNATGHYLFANLVPDTYLVEAVAPAGHLSSTGTTGSPTGPYEPAPDPDNDVDSDDNGTTAGTVVRSAPVTLALDTEPTGEALSTGLVDPATDVNSNLSVDFGFFQPLSLSLGNRVWLDVNNNGLLDSGESGIAGVTVNLYRDGNGDGAPDGAAIGTTITNATGHYLFTNLSADTYLVEAVTPAGHLSSTGTALSPTGPYEPAPDPDNNVDSDDNGTTAGTIVRSGPVTLAFGTEPTGEALSTGLIDNATDVNSNLTVDFGFFRPMSLGNRVWLDVNNNGLLDSVESGITGVVVNLYRDSNGDGTPDGAALATATTNATGHYLFANLVPDTYLVEAVTPAGHVSSTGTVGSETGPYQPAPDPDNDVDSDDNGSNAGAVVRSGPVTLVLGTEPTGEAPTTGLVDNAANIDSNLTVDFGFFRPMSLGNLVWEDTNNSGVRDANEAGLGNVTVRLLDVNGTTTLATTTTNANGNYRFRNLVPGTYVVEIVCPANYRSSSGGATLDAGPYEPAPSPENNVDHDDNGTTSGGNARSAVTLVLGGEPRNEPADGLIDSAADSDSNLTVDFGLVRTEPPKRTNNDSKLMLLASSVTPGYLQSLEKFVNQLYGDVIGREADQAGFDDHVTLLLAGIAPTDVSRGFWTSAEARARLVDGLYRQYLRRSADLSGQQFFVQQLLNGASEADVALQILTSPEYLSTHTTAEAFLTGLYGDVLGRTVDDSGRAFWLPQLQNPANWGNVARAILTSQESVARVVGQLYLDYLHRPADAAGLAFYVSQLMNRRATLTDVAVSLLSSDEYFRRP